MIDLLRHNDTEIATFGPVDERSLQQLKTCIDAGKNVPYAVLCADHHPGYSQPIGAAIGYIDQISPSGVGFDIGCGNLAVKTSLKYEDVDEVIPEIMKEIQDRISFGVGRKNNEPIDHAVLDDIENAYFVPQRSLLELARQQLGTVGSGNHYVDLFRDEDGYIWVGVHFGSRGFGHKTASGFLAMSQGKKFNERGVEGEMDSPPILFDVDSTIGQDYIAAMDLAGKYANAGRETVVIKVLEILNAFATKVVYNHHNFAWKENHFGQDMWVIRKGCTPLYDLSQSFVGSTMGSLSVVISGIMNSEDTAHALRSTIHGAGRVMSRRQAAGKQKWIDGKRITVKPGLVDYGEVLNTMKEKNVVVLGGGADEAPQVYKELARVLTYHSSTITIDIGLYPVGVVMAGEEYDPYKD